MTPKPKVDLDRVAGQCTALQLTHIDEYLPVQNRRCGSGAHPPVRKPGYSVMPPSTNSVAPVR